MNIPRWVQSAILLLVAAFLCLVSTVLRYDTPAHAVVEISANGAFASPQAYFPGPYPKSIMLDPSVSMDLLVILCNHMRVHSADMDASFAGEYRSNVRVIYLPERDLFLINLIVDPPMPGDEMTECHDKIGHEMVKKRRARKITGQFLTEFLTPARDTFQDGEACMLQAILDKI